MNDQQQTLSFDESVAQVMQTLPPIIRNYLAQGKYTDVAKALINKYRLRIDQGGILEREIMLLLMGIETPDEFVQALTEEVKLDQETVNRIVQDVNTEVFIPLREEMRGGGKAEPVKAPPIVAPTAPRVTSLPPRTVIIPANPQLPPRPPQAPVPKYGPPPPPPRPMPPPPIKGSQTSLNPARLLEDHEEPHIEFKKPAPTPYNLPPTPSSVPPNLPGAMPPPPTPYPLPPTPSAPPRVQPPPLPPPPPQPKPVSPPTPVKPYSADPYREPIE